jgi:hypothetical protein
MESDYQEFENGAADTIQVSQNATIPKLDEM